MSPAVVPTRASSTPLTRVAAPITKHVRAPRIRIRMRDEAWRPRGSRPVKAVTWMCSRAKCAARRPNTETRGRYQYSAVSYVPKSGRLNRERLSVLTTVWSIMAISTTEAATVTTLIRVVRNRVIRVFSWERVRCGAGWGPEECCARHMRRNASKYNTPPRGVQALLTSSTPTVAPTG